MALGSDISMLPNSKQGFSPIVRGVAQTNALVKVIQNGNVVYQENVPPGAFTLDHIQPTGSAGDLTVVVTEADGSEQSFNVPFSAVPNMLKQGVTKYSLMAGNVNQDNTDYSPSFFQGTVQYGLNNVLTGYTGTTLSNDYRAYLVGSGLNLPIGAVSADLTHSSTQLKSKSQSGQSVRLAYSKFLTRPLLTLHWQPIATPLKIIIVSAMPFTLRMDTVSATGKSRTTEAVWMRMRLLSWI